MGEAKAEVVHSLAKWKRLTLAKFGVEPGYGIYTDMNAIRADEEMDNLHSLYVDQWDWEAVITKEERTIAFLEDVVRRIYSAILRTEFLACENFPQLKPFLRMLSARSMALCLLKVSVVNSLMERNMTVVLLTMTTGQRLRRMARRVSTEISSSGILFSAVHSSLVQWVSVLIRRACCVS